MTEFIINHEPLDIITLYSIIDESKILKLSKQSKDNVVECRDYLDNKILDSDSPLYGINTGFGSLYNVSIKDDDLSKLQHNLILSHSCGVGDKVPVEIVKIILLLKIITLSKGHSGVHLKTLNRLIFFYNNNIFPVIFKHGSLGASGDLSPLAHLSLPLIGEGQVYYKGCLTESKDVLKEFNLSSLELRSKEGLALLNGTQFMSGYGLYLLFQSYKLSYMADLISSVSLDGFDCRTEPFDDLIQKVRPHKGQSTIANRINSFRNDSEIANMVKIHTQDPYSFRCIPQVHGASLDTIHYVASVILNEVNSINDNPIIFHKEDRIISGGNFHGQPLAYVLDFLKIAISEIGNISERRTYNLISGQRNLPQFLVNNPGLNSGFMIPQYTAASLVSLNKQLSSPSSVDSIVSSNGQEDHVSMGANSAILLFDIVENVKRILSIELFNAAQALELKKPLKTSDYLQNFIKSYREKVGFVSEDKIMANEINSSLDFIENYSVSDGLFTF
ncbi:histidine ammonia-lyase [Flavobacteriaceae bacterium]|nr:histidine ammonia-lyase [Flavobacteriaceae bacterium]MDB9712950.1 histidine ammonia-lyase [Flavobacteriaceae bacterium]MDC1491832.1 histidine ammonia-lyase [Flavobacteriaceae bacterium]